MRKDSVAEKTMNVLSAGAPKSAVSGCAQAFTEKTGIAVAVEFATAPVLRETIAGGMAAVDVVIASIAAAKAFEDAGHTVAGSGAVIGSVKAAVTVRIGALEPDLSCAESLRKAMLDADALVYNVASSGQYIATMIETLGIADEVAVKTTRTKTGAGVMEHLHASGLNNEIGFAQATEIQVQIDKGLNVKLLGTLPKALEIVTTYRSAILSAASSNADAGDFLAFMASEQGQRICQQTGLD
ncbi:MAG: molybdate transport system substrate-binding protein [Gammaproteobacteria bacterium]